MCRGSIALSVIDDHFWVAFKDSEKNLISQDSEIFAQVSSKLKMPSELENNAKLLSVWKTYNDTVNDYFMAKVEYLDNHLKGNQGFGINQLWNGNHVNENAALTVYRHYDSATVLKGFDGEMPKTGWIMDYPIFVRVHYLLVVGFDVYGKVGDQLSTRLYMFFLRIESELEFLAFLPVKDRLNIHRHWYRDSDVTDNLKLVMSKMNIECHKSQINYKDDDVKKIFVKISQHLKNAQKSKGDYLNRCLDLPEICKKSGWAKKPVFLKNHELKRRIRLI